MGVGSSVELTKQRWRSGLTLALGLLLLAAGWWLRSPLHHLPLERDEGAYVLIAARWLAGAALYRDLFDHKPPLVYLVYALTPYLSRDPVVAVRALATSYLLLTGAATAALAAYLYGRVVALGALILTLAYGSGQAFQGLTFNTEAIMALPSVLACLLTVAGLRSRNLWLLALGGVGVGVAIAAKPVGGLLLIPLGLAALLASWPWRRRITALLLAFGGAALPMLLIILYLARQGALPAAYNALVVYNRIYAAESLSRGWDVAGLARMWAPMLPLAAPAAIGLIVTGARFRAFLARRRQSAVGSGETVRHQLASGELDERRLPRAVAALWGLALLLGALLSLRAYPHYYLALVPFAAMWAGAAIAWLGRQVPNTPAALMVQASLFALLAAPPARSLRELAALEPLEQSSALYGHDGQMFFGAAATVAEYVRQHVPRGQPIFVWAAEPEIYYLARRPPATRFVYDYPLDNLPGARDEVLDTLRASPPLLIITYHAVRPLGFHPFMDDNGYTLTSGYAGYDIYEREPTK
jgi:hypothetical protein